MSRIRRARFLCTAAAMAFALGGAAAESTDASSTGGSTVQGAGPGVSAPPRSTIRVDPVRFPIAPAEMGGVNANASGPFTAQGTGSVAGAPPAPSAIVNANVGLSLISPNANVAVNANAGAAVIPNARPLITNATGVPVTNANLGGPVVFPPAGTLVLPSTAVPLGAPVPLRRGNTGSGSGPGFAAGGVAPSGPAIERAMSSSGTAGLVAPSGPGVENLPAAGAPTTDAATR